LRVRWLALVVLSFATDASADRHVMERGQTLEHVARAYGCSVDAVLRANRLDNVLVPAGTVVRVPACPRARPRTVAVHQADDRARRALEVIDGTPIVRPSQVATPPADPVVARVQTGASRSEGEPWNGRLYNARELPPGDGYTIRRPQYAFGADHVVDTVRRVIAEVRARHPHVHSLAIGDLSAPNGGKLEGHRSHQSGLDIDIGLYYKKVPKTYPANFANAKDVDLEALWSLVVGFARTADQPTGVHVILLDYHIQARLYYWALKHGVPRDELAVVLQYPRKKSELLGVVRHWRNHHDHLHVRFKP
jgi:LysM repeat protein